MINILGGINNTSSALDAERFRMDVITQNIANSTMTRDVDGKPYQRRLVVFEKMLSQQLGTDAMPSGVQVARVIKDQRPPQMIYDPDNPQADAKGMIAMPNVNIHEEMADLIAAGRTFEANLAVLRTAKQMVTQTFSIGKR